MMRSMYSGVSGLKVQQTRMDVIGNNISNVNTVGYKSQRVTFNDVFSQTLSGASSANDDTGRGGTNPSQVGLGVTVGSIDMLMTTGATERTDNPFDCMVNGSGFIVVKDSSGTYFTRNGALRTDADGNLMISTGHIVQGWYADTDGNIVKGETQGINLNRPSIQSNSPTATTQALASGNLCSTDVSVPINMKIFDSLGNQYTMKFTATRGTTDASGTTSWSLAPTTETVSVTTTAAGGATTTTDVTGIFLTDSNGNKYKTTATGTATIKFNANGELTSDSAQNLEINMPGVVTDTTGKITSGTFGSNGKIEVDVSGLTQYATTSTCEIDSKNGSKAATLSDYSLGTDGIIYGVYSDGSKKAIAQVVVAEFDNPEGLEKVGDSLYKVTANSGDFDGIGQAGNFYTGVLEMSNVDLAQEFTNMIVTQRGFQANSRIISVSDEMLQELANLK